MELQEVIAELTAVSLEAEKELKEYYANYPGFTFSKADLGQIWTSGHPTIPFSDVIADNMLVSHKQDLIWGTQKSHWDWIDEYYQDRFWSQEGF